MQELALDDFESAARAILRYLHERLGFGLWMVTRTQGDDFIVLQSEDHGYAVTPGKVFNWVDTFCFNMVRGNGPRIAPVSDQVPAYAAASVGQMLPIKAYIGVPLTNADGSLFGTLCAIDPVPHTDEILQDQAQIELLASLLSAILRAELKTAQEIRRSERLELEALADPLTRLSNRRAWDQLLAREEDRCRRYGHPAAVFSIDLDELKQVNDRNGHPAGDRMIEATADALREAVREIDIVARLGGDEFGIIAVECDKAGADALLVRAREALARKGIPASLGMSMRNPELGLEPAWKEADRLMYKEKHGKQMA